MSNNDLWAELTDYAISKGFTVGEWEQKKSILETALRQLFIKQNGGAA